MSKFFHYINKQPKQVRENYALGIASVFTMAVLLFWVASRFDILSLNATEGEVSAMEESTSPFSTLLKESKEKFSSIKASLTQASKTTEDTNAQVAAVINSSSTNPSGLILSEENLEEARFNLENSTVTDYLSERIYSEVMIATTSASALNEESCFEISTSSSGLGTTTKPASCFGLIKTSSPTIAQ